MQQEVKAGFAIEELVGDRYFEGDTINGANLVRFTALQDGDEYTWTIGAETIHTKSFSRKNFPHGQWVDVKLVIRRNPNKLCFPYDDGIDSSARTFYAWPQYSNINMEKIGPYYPIYGTYRGHYSNNPSFEFSVSLFDTLWRNKNNQPWFVGIIRGMPSPLYRLEEITRDYLFGDVCPSISPKALQIQFSGANGHLVVPPVGYIIPRMFGYAWLDRANTNRIHIHYVQQDTITNTTYSDTLFFTGTRIN